jgi:hypothetical protein
MLFDARWVKKVRDAGEDPAGYFHGRPPLSG